MTVKDAIEKRKSIRKYLDKPISEDDLKTILEAGRLAPSARNLQRWKFIVVTDKEKRMLLQKACHDQKMIGEAPATLVVLGKGSRMLPVGHEGVAMDASIALSFMILQATELGIGTCWLGLVKSEMVKEVLNIPDEFNVVAVTPLGYPAEEGVPRNRKDFEKIVCFEEFK